MPMVGFLPIAHLSIAIGRNSRMPMVLWTPPRVGSEPTASAASGESGHSRKRCESQH